MAEPWLGRAAGAPAPPVRSAWRRLAAVGAAAGVAGAVAAGVALVRPALVRASRPLMSCAAAPASYGLNAAAWRAPWGALSSTRTVPAVGAVTCGRVLYVPLAFLYAAVQALGGSLQPEHGPPKTLAISGRSAAGPAVVGQVVTVTAVAPGEVSVRLSNAAGPARARGGVWTLRLPVCAWCGSYVGREVILLGDPRTARSVTLLGRRQGEMVVGRPVRASPG